MLHVTGVMIDHSQYSCEHTEALCCILYCIAYSSLQPTVAITHPLELPAAVLLLCHCVQYECADYAGALTATSICPIACLHIACSILLVSWMVTTEKKVSRQADQPELRT